MYNFFESSMRGGKSVISKKYAKANNPYIPESYNLEQPTSYLVYYDATSLNSSLFGKQRRVKTSKLSPTKDKPNYICHYRNLQLYLELGLK
ncbi:hypothetical protein KUTeg_011921 [Tegillarca granosa]|uniref:Uncharacterized protein n=1 Tax=Tegillarca granosa TaxID=220873 RepID=A0ABQ9EY18_TEGGR|nr:hypothetical protein KUTeg_011921 [Tegillarca granosa]